MVHMEMTEVFPDHYVMPTDFDNEIHNAPEWQPFVESRVLFGGVDANSKFSVWG